MLVDHVDRFYIPGRKIALCKAITEALGTGLRPENVCIDLVEVWREQEEKAHGAATTWQSGFDRIPDGPGLHGDE